MSAILLILPEFVNIKNYPPAAETIEDYFVIFF